MPPLLQSCVDAHSMPSALSNTNLCAGTKQVFSWKGRLQRIGTAEERRKEKRRKSWQPPEGMDAAVMVTMRK